MRYVKLAGFLIFYLFYSLHKIWKKLRPQKSIGKYLRPLGAVEEFLEKAHQQKFLISSYCLTLNSIESLQPKSVEEALKILQRYPLDLPMMFYTKIIF